jgi:hypothetical protein
MLSFENCAVQKISLNENHPNNFDQPVISIKHHFYLWGMFQNREIDLIEECTGDEPTFVIEKHTYLDFVSTLFTAGIYFPRTTEIFCKEIDK